MFVYCLLFVSPHFFILLFLILFLRVSIPLACIHCLYCFSSFLFSFISHFPFSLWVASVFRSFLYSSGFSLVSSLVLLWFPVSYLPFGACLFSSPSIAPFSSLFPDLLAAFGLSSLVSLSSSPSFSHPFPSLPFSLLLVASFPHFALSLVSSMVPHPLLHVTCPGMPPLSRQFLCTAGPVITIHFPS